MSATMQLKSNHVETLDKIPLPGNPFPIVHIKSLEIRQNIVSGTTTITAWLTHNTNIPAVLRNPFVHGTAHWLTW